MEAKVLAVKKINERQLLTGSKTKSYIITSLYRLLIILFQNPWPSKQQ